MSDQGLTEENLNAAREAKERFGHALLSHPDVHGVGVGRRRRTGEKTDELAVVVHLQRKLPETDVESTRLLPAELRWVDAHGREVVVPVDVQEHPKPEPENARVRPVPGGVSAGISGTDTVAAGTLGGWVWDTVTNQAVALSNAHVFGAHPGVSITQPSVEDGGLHPVDRIASVLRAGSLDSAIAAPADAGVISATIVNGGKGVFELADARVDMRVQKTGRSTGLTFGTVDLIDFDSDYRGSHTDLWIDSEDGDFSTGGDSGALYLESSADGDHNERCRVVGLHWGGSGNDGVGHHIKSVFRDLGLATLPSGSSNHSIRTP